jgi:hypothetical protein
MQNVTTVVHIFCYSLNINRNKCSLYVQQLVRNICLMSMLTMIVRERGFLELNPSAIASLMWWRAVFVECLLLNLSWDGMFGMFCVICGKTIFQGILQMDQRNEIDLYEEPKLGSLFGLRIGIILDNFQICGICCCSKHSSEVTVNILWSLVLSAWDTLSLCCLDLWSCYYWLSLSHVWLALLLFLCELVPIYVYFFLWFCYA